MYSGHTARRFAFCISLAIVVVGAFPNGASSQTPNPYLPFAIDGNVLPAPGGNSKASGDATMFVDAHGNAKEIGPGNGSNTKFPIIHSSSPSGLLGDTNPNGQTDLHQVFFQTVQDSRGHAWVYFGWSRDSNSGSGFVAFEAHQVANNCETDGVPGWSAAELLACNPWSPRTTDDFGIFWDQSGSSNNIYLREWSGTAFVPEQPGTLLNSLTDPDQPAGGDRWPIVFARYSTDLFRGEMALDLTAAGVVPPGSCQAFPNVIPLTLTGNSPNDSADLKDAVLQPISLNTCGTLTISKVTLAPDGLALQHTTADFEYVLKKGNTVIPVGTTKLAGCANSAPSACTPDSDSYSALSPGNDYSLEEVGTLPGKYLLKSIVCDTFKATSGALTFTVPPSGNVTCTITNQLPAGVMTFSTTPTVKALLYDSAVSIKLEYSIGAGGTKTVTFELFKNSVNCSTESQGTRTATATFANGVDGSASTLPSDGTTNAPPAFLVISPGDTYYWKVTVPGDSKNDPLTKCGEATTVSWSTS